MTQHKKFQFLAVALVPHLHPTPRNHHHAGMDDHCFCNIHVYMRQPCQRAIQKRPDGARLDPSHWQLIRYRSLPACLIAWGLSFFHFMLLFDEHLMIFLIQLRIAAMDIK
jgi:hypothetical protein